MGKWENVLITHPTFDSQRLRTYSYLANNNESVESQLTITRTRFDIDSGSPISADETFYVEGISSIKEYAMKSVWYPRGFHPQPRHPHRMSQTGFGGLYRKADADFAA